MITDEYFNYIAHQQQNNKYHAKKVTVGDDVYDSMGEYARYQELILLEQAGEISDLERQKKFVLIPTQRDQNGKVLERECSYIADFCCQLPPPLKRRGLFKALQPKRSR